MSGAGRIAERFALLRRESRGGFVAYLTAGDPHPSRTASLVEALDRGGADVIELGVPFSDPLADGPVIQRASERALAAGATLGRVLESVCEVRPRVDAGIVLFSYANPILAYGAPRFLADASAAGVDGLLVLDLPPEEMGDFREGLIAHGLDPIFLIAPTSSEARIRQAAALGRGFLYGISRLGVTGMRQEVGDAAAELATRVKAITEMPLALGFGVSEPDHVRAFQRIADAAVVGSRLVDAVARHGHEPDLPDRIEAMVRWLRGCGEKPQE
jgi:tryptophan synthase alpha chain